jgi:membrane protein DedA with SNARE-associated domain
LGGLVSAYIQHFSYIGLFLVLILCGFGLPFPEDIALLAGGFMVHRNITGYPLTLVVSLVGVVTGDNSLFLIGRRFGSNFLIYLGIERPHSRKSIEWMREFMRKHGAKTIFYARFFAGLRAVVYLSAGSLGLSPGRFFWYDLLGAMISVPLMVSLGYLFGEQIDTAARYLGGIERLIVILVLLSACFFLGRLALYGRQRGTAETGPF